MVSVSDERLQRHLAPHHRLHQLRHLRPRLQSADQAVAQVQELQGDGVRSLLKWVRIICCAKAARFFQMKNKYWTDKYFCEKTLVYRQMPVGFFTLSRSKSCIRILLRIQPKTAPQHCFNTYYDDFYGPSLRNRLRVMKQIQVILRYK